jgi:hypothetical protein
MMQDGIAIQLCDLSVRLAPQRLRTDRQQRHSHACDQVAHKQLPNVQPDIRAEPSSR